MLRILDKIENTLFRLIFIAAILLGVYAMYDSWYLYHNAQDRSLLAFKPSYGDGPAAPKAEVPDDMVAWLTIDGTTIDFPIMQGADNYEYLNKDPQGAYSLSGSIFLDARNASDFSNSYSLVYGHHMEMGAMFGALDAFADRDYFDSHRDGTLSFGGSEHPVRVFAFANVKASDEAVFDPTDGHDTLGFIRENASVYEEPEDGRILALTTCVDGGSDERTAVFCILPDKEACE